MMKLLHLSAVSATIICFVPVLYLKAIAQEPDYACFMTTASGQVIDLSESVCKIMKSAPTAQAETGNNDQAFLEDYRRTVSNFPDVRDNLLARVEKTPEQGISEAKDVCNELKEGLSIEEIQQNQVSENYEKANIFNASVVSTLATKYYCPEFNNR
ncbi:MAG: DUF732 domain-containing protein [Gloeocapsa sp. UFS-A4-WI-NPMV-4B04]|jgi:uncharacterized surface anchored protein|nr:DUF732 domain-containing protein [Gloeocapsa sp. UFS-A4-WI-NPMV-4B04]